ncbi:MAG: nucleoside triphosphate pyrophosphohydrolase [Bacteroidetes bacterium]|nr:nucleoside triphosphate pyrophosphohydrolase [Bacteroidota bacterium]
MERKKAIEAFGKLLDIMDELREKCPWDKEQTIASIRHLSIEEVHELSDAIIENNPEEIKKEVGDLLLHIVFYGKIADELKWFDTTDIINALCDKLIRRHPHIYGDVLVNNADDVKHNWEQIKQNEKKSNDSKSFLSGVPSSMPSLIKALRMQEKAAQTGFDWNKKEDVLAKVWEEWEEFKNAVDKQEKEAEFGDFLFSLVNFARFEGINPDDALEATNQKFKKRFEYIESKARENGLKLDNLTLHEMDVWWNEAKKL